MEGKGESFKPDIESTLLRVIIYLVVLNIPFLGLYKNLVLGALEPGTYYLLLAGIICFVASVYFSNKFFNIRFGWTEDGVFKQGVFRYTEIKWGEIKRIYETGSSQEWTEGDMLFIRKKTTGKKVFVVESSNKKIVLEFYRPMVEFRKSIAAKLNLEVGSKYNVAWDFIVNG